MATTIPVSSTKIAHNMHSLKRKTRSIGSYRRLRQFVFSRVERSVTSVKDVEFLTSMEDVLIFNSGRTYFSTGT